MNFTEDSDARFAMCSTAHSTAHLAAHSVMHSDMRSAMRFADEAEPLSNPDQGAGTSVLERPETQEETVRDDGGDADRFAHYVSRDRIAESRMTGRPVVALCGKIWVPKHDPSQYPVCPDCKRIYEEMTR